MATNPSGLIGVWAVENTRDAIFDAIRKKEVFGGNRKNKLRFLHHR
jgi:nitrous oxidase accessory protein NosD